MSNKRAIHIPKGAPWIPVIRGGGGGGGGWKKLIGWVILIAFVLWLVKCVLDFITAVVQAILAAIPYLLLIGAVIAAVIWRKELVKIWKLLVSWVKANFTGNHSAIQSQTDSHPPSITPLPARKKSIWVVIAIALVIGIGISAYICLRQYPPVLCTWMPTQDDNGYRTFNCRLKNESANHLRLNVTVKKTNGMMKKYGTWEIEPQQDLPKRGWFEGFRFDDGDVVVLSSADYWFSRRLTVK